MRDSEVIRLLERSARSSPLAPRSHRAAKTGGLVHCGLVLQKVDGRGVSYFPEAEGLWSDRDALSRDIADVMIAMSDPTSSRWSFLIEHVRALAESTTVYFSDAAPNPARDEFLAEWELVRRLAH
jgi:hypothetical protein